MQLKFINGHLLITPDDDCKAIVDAMLLINYDQEFCIAFDFEPEFIARLMEAGFLVMSAIIETEDGEPHYLMLPKLHLLRSVLFFDNLHIKKSIRGFLDSKKYDWELRTDSDFETIIDRCLEKHGDDWLTPALVDCIKRIRNGEGVNRSCEPAPALLPTPYPYPASFGLYRNGKLVAGEFGVVCGKVYTSYSGYYDEANAGTVQIILTTRYLQENGFLFFDLGMPLDYKTDLGAEDISPESFTELFRIGQAGT